MKMSRSKIDLIGGILAVGAPILIHSLLFCAFWVSLSTSLPYKNYIFSAIIGSLAIAIPFLAFALSLFTKWGASAFEIMLYLCTACFGSLLSLALTLFSIMAKVAPTLLSLEIGDRGMTISILMVAAVIIVYLSIKIPVKKGKYMREILLIKSEDVQL